MSSGSRFGRSVGAVGLVLVDAAVVALAIYAFVGSGDPVSNLAFAGGGVITAALGSGLIRKVPGNRVGLVLLMIGASMVLSDGMRVLFGEGPERVRQVAGVIESSVFVLPWTGISLLLLVFPTGVARPRWRWLARIVLAIGVAGVVGGVVWASQLSLPELMAGRLAETDSGNPAEIASAATFFLMPVSIAGLVARFRSGDAIERAQIRWLMLAAGLLFVVVAAQNVVEQYEGMAASLAGMIGLVSIPISVAVAVTRYRLFEIDRLISRSVSYAVVLGVLGAVFAVAVAVPSSLVGGENAPAWVVAGSTLLVAALFSPVRRRVQTVVDRQFNRSRYDAQRVADGFGVSLRDAGDLGAVTGSLGKVVMEVFQPSHLGLWVEGRET